MVHGPLGVESRMWSCAETWKEVVDGPLMVERGPDLSRTRRVIVRVFAGTSDRSRAAVHRVLAVQRRSSWKRCHSYR